MSKSAASKCRIRMPHPEIGATGILAKRTGSIRLSSLGSGVVNVTPPPPQDAAAPQPVAAPVAMKNGAANRRKQILVGEPRDSRPRPRAMDSRLIAHDTLSRASGAGRHTHSIRDPGAHGGAE